jgi:hypothetical protein
MWEELLKGMNTRDGALEGQLGGWLPQSFTAPFENTGLHTQFLQMLMHLNDQ